MKRIIFVLLILLILSSCQLDNIYQKMGIATKEPLKLNTSVVKPEISDDNIELVRSMVGEGLIIQYNIDVPSHFTGYILCSQTKEELEDLTSMINAKCYSEEEIQSFLKAKLTDEKSILALKGVAQLLKSSSVEIQDALKNLLPKVEIGDDLSESEKSAREQYNEIVDAIHTLIADFISSCFNPIISMLDSDNLTNGDLIKCQLTVNLLDGLLTSVNDICKFVINTSSLKIENIRINQPSDIENLATGVKNELTKTSKYAISSTVNNLLSPIACLDRITFNNESLVGLPSFNSLLNFFVENKK